jgi:hypothetical protein
MKSTNKKHFISRLFYYTSSSPLNVLELIKLALHSENLSCSFHFTFFICLFIYLFIHFIFYFLFLSSLVSGHCDRKLLQNSVAKWLKWRETLSLHRALVDCKMFHTTGEQNNNYSTTISNSYSYSERDNDNNDNRGSVSESRHADLKDLTAERRRTPSVFILSSPRPILAVYYLRFDIWLLFHFNSLFCIF